MTNREALAYCLQNTFDETCSVDVYDKVGMCHWVTWEKEKIRINSDSEFESFSKDGEPYFKSLNEYFGEAILDEVQP